MATKSSKNNNAKGIVKMLIFSVLAALTVTAVLLLITAVLLDKMGLSASQSQIMVYAVYIISALVAGLIAGKWKREKKFMWGALAGIVWLLVVFAVSVARNGLGIDVKELFPAVVCMLGGGMLGGMLA